MKKDEYIKPVVEIIEVENNDIITSSGNSGISLPIDYFNNP